MAIIQISKIQQRAGNLVDLPQLDNAEFGWAADENRLFIGRTGNTFADENIEVITSYSNVSFSQISGSAGSNINIDTPLNGQILTYVSSTDSWENYDGTTAQLGGDKLQLGSVSNISMTGGAIGYVLQTDGLGNLSWAPAGSGGGGGGAGGSNTSVQFNDQNISNGAAAFTYNKDTVTLTVTSGNIVAGNINATTNITSPVLTSNIATGTAPFTVTSTTQVANLSVATAGTVTTAAQGNITSVGTLSSLTVSGNVDTGGIKTDNYYYANGTAISFAGTYNNGNVYDYLTGSNSVAQFTGVIAPTSVTTANITTGANTTAGTLTGNFSLSDGSQLNATYADLAEYYSADKKYEAGTVLAFGGDNEVTIAEDGTTKVAGVVSTNPAYVMNSLCKGQYIVPVALQGRVPCKVRGTISKGDMLVSGGNGFARPSQLPVMGTVIGKALQNFEGEGVIEVAVGRL